MRYKTIPVVMCVYKRPERLSTTLDQLTSQVGCKVKLYIWNNNYRLRNNVAKTVAKYPKLDITLHNNKVNVGGFARFYMARKLSSRYPAIIFIDDDIELSPESIITLVKEFRPRTIHSFFTFRITSRRNFFKRYVPNPGDEADWCGTGGMICDATIFRQDGLFECPERYSFVEDVWLSYYASHILGWKLYRSATDIKIVEDDKNQYPKLRPLKAEFYKYLRKNGWEVPRLNSMNWLQRLLSYF